MNAKGTPASPSAIDAQITQMLKDWESTGVNGLDHLMPAVYQHIHRIAKSELAKENGEKTLQPTALVNEVYLELRDMEGLQFESRNQFFALCGFLVRRMLVADARRKGREKHGGHMVQVALEDLDRIDDSIQTLTNLIALNDAMERLEKLDPRKVRIIEMRFFAGLSLEQVSAVLDVSLATIKRDWQFTRRWLATQLAPSKPAS